MPASEFLPTLPATRSASRLNRALLLSSLLVLGQACSTDVPSGPDAVRPPALRAVVLPANSSTTYTTNFGEYATGVSPTGWSQPWDLSAQWQVAADTLATGGKVLQWSGTGLSRDRFALQLDRFGDVNDQAVYSEVRIHPNPSPSYPSYMGSVAVRMGGSSSDERGYILYFVDNSSVGARSLVLATWSGGIYVQLQDLPMAWVDDAWYSVRLEALGTDIRARVWPRGTTEPTTWPIEVQDARYASGRPGVGNHDNGLVQWDVWSVDVAPPAPPPPPPPSGRTWTETFVNGVAGSAPVGWTATSAPGGITWAVANDATASDGVVLRGTSTTTARHILRYDSIPGTTVDQEAVVRFRMGDADGYGPGIALRHTMSNGAETAYVAYLRTGSGEVEIDRFVGGGWGYVGSAPFPSSPGTWYLMRFSAQAGTLRVRLWPASANEPTAWTLSANDATIGAGSAGVYVYEPNAVDYDAFTAATGGLSAPVPNPSLVTRVVVKPDSAVVPLGGTQAFTAYGRTLGGDSVAISVTWAATGGTISAAGLFTAGAAPGTFSVSATGPNSAPVTTVPVRIPPPPPPAAPGALTATALSSSSIALTWTDNSSNEDGFQVERAPDAGGVPGTFAQVMATAPNATSFTDAPVASATRYWYRVRAFNTGGTSGYTASVSATTPQPPPPAAPSGLAAVAASSTSATLTWTDNATSETGFTVERAPDVSGAAGTYAQVASLGADATTYTSTGLTSGARYWFRVRAFNGGGNSAYSNAASVTLPVLPAAPSTLAATVISSTSIALTWRDNSTNETGFAVDRAPDVSGAPGTWAQVATTAAGATSYTDTSLSGSTRYWFRVRAFNLAGTSAASNQVAATTSTVAPSNLTATARLNSGVPSAALAWTAGTAATVDVYRGANRIVAAIANGGSYTDADPGLDIGTTYTYRVCVAGQAVSTATCTNTASVTL